MKTHCLNILLLSLILMLSACSKAHRRAFQQTQEIKKYGLVFRLQDYKQRIDYFEKHGMTDRARLEQSQIEEYNRNLVACFRKEFNFCPIHFYYASQSEELKAGMHVLLNSDMKPDTSIPLPEKLILANFGLGKRVDNTFQWESFQVEGTSIHIRPVTYSPYDPTLMELEDVRKVNRALYKKNRPRH